MAQHNTGASAASAADAHRAGTSAASSQPATSKSSKSSHPASRNGSSKQAAEATTAAGGDKASKAGADKTASGASSRRRSPRKGASKASTAKLKHVELEHKRPKITPVEDGEASSEEYSRPRTRSKRTAASTAGTVRKRPGATLKVIPLGGLDAIGKNMTVFECGDDMILVDSGLMFPDDNHPGVDLILPDYTYVLENEDRLKGILITHGHEDHTGALPYLMKDLSRKVPIYATKLTLGLIEGKFAEHRIKAKLAQINPGDQIKLGNFVIDFFAVNHSIPGAVGIFLQSPAGNVLHTGDFKLDQSPIDGVHTDFAALSRFGQIGVDLMMSDSTNATKTSFTPSESEVGKTLRQIISGAKGRVIVASFASHIHRLQQIADAAVENGRKVVVTGRSMIQNTDIARRLGYLNIQDVDLIDAYDLKQMPPEKVVIMCTGSQGEPLSALARIAAGEHRTIDIDPGDTVIISATPVPGNEKAVTRIVNALAKIGCDVYDKSRAMVHVSGHAGAEELKLVLSIVSPKNFMPVHGEASHLRAHARLAEATGVAPDHIFMCENGDTLELSTDGVRFGEPVESGIVYVDGLSVGDTSRDVLDERVVLSNFGVASIAAAVNPKRKQVLGEVKVEMRGITGGDVTELRSEARDVVSGALRRALEKGTTGSSLEKVCRDAMLSIVWERAKQRPVVVCSIIEI